MSIIQSRQYIAVDFLQDDFNLASDCLEQMAHGGLEYALARTYTVKNLAAPTIERLYRMERRAFHPTTKKSLSLIARLAFRGDALSPDAIRPTINQMGKDGNKMHKWLYGHTLSAAKLFAYGQNIFHYMEVNGDESLSLPVWRDDGDKLLHRKKPKTRLDALVFSLNTSRKNPHWIGHLHIRSLVELEDHDRNLMRHPSRLSFLNLKII